MLALPLQRGSTGDTIKWTSDFINTTFGPNSASRFDKDLTFFQKVRQSAVAVSEASGEAGLTPLSVAIHHLKSVAPRLTEYSSNLKLTFCYQDAFWPTKSISSNSLYYDLSIFLWNFAALQSQIGSRIERSSDDGIRAANKHFQSAAGALEWICDNCMQHLSDGNSSGPINASVLRMMIMLMLAQAQLCFYEKSVRDRKAGLMKPAIIAKLAAQTSHFYRASADLSKNDYCGAYIDATWSNHADYQHKCFAAAAEYWQSQAVREEALSRGCGYGEEIARLLRATATLKQAIDTATANKLSPSLTNGAAALRRTVDAAKAAAEKDNNTVYMEQIPADNTLAPVPPVAMAKPLQLPEYAGAFGRTTMA
jgi:BRO1-like domain